MAEFWRGNPNYSYGWVVPPLTFYFAVRRFNSLSPDAEKPKPIGQLTLLLAAFVFSSIVGVLEFLRQEVWAPVIVSWLIALVPILLSLAICFLVGGYRLARAEIFPFFFFLTSAPWPPRLEYGVTVGLMRVVAKATVGLLHFVGISAGSAGGAILLPTGIVGITEACSGIRSLQAGMMLGLACGEWFFLRPGKRVALLALSVLLALLTNFVRTLVLALVAARHGIESVDSVHDLAGTIAIVVLVVSVYFCGRLFARRQPAAEEVGNLKSASFPAFSELGQGALLFLVAGAVGFAVARTSIARIEADSQMQTSPNFRLDPNSSWQPVRLPREMWQELHPTAGQYWRGRFDSGLADSYHFFWEPSARNRFVLIHRPDVCMPGVGWRLEGLPQPLKIDLAGREADLHAFRFVRDRYQALELWGVWRNGSPVAIDYRPEQVLGTATKMNLVGKRQSATEIIACSVISERGPPDLKTVTDLLKSVFRAAAPAD